MKPPPTKEELLMQAITIYKRVFNNNLPTHAGCGPGRVNLIGEHTDYNNGFVFPMALPNVILMTGAENGTNEINIYSEGVSDVKKVTFTIPSLKTLVRGDPNWANYVKGVVNFFNAAVVPGFDAVIVSSVPLGAGVSSSAAIEVATFTFLEALTGTTVDKKEKALICQKAEHIFAEMPCGIMDQYISIFGEKGHALLLDCKTCKHELIPFDDLNVCILIINSNVKHELTGSEYPLRAAQCREASAIMDVKSLREASTHDLEKHRNAMSDEMFRRARHVVSEISRTCEAAQALRFKDYSSFGVLMLQSHNSLRDDYEVSVPELDELVDIVMRCKGVFGSRLTGAGFGGATVTLLRAEVVANTIEAVLTHFRGAPDFYIATASDGADDLTDQLNEILASRK